MIVIRNVARMSEVSAGKRMHFLTYSPVLHPRFRLYRLSNLEFRWYKNLPCMICPSLPNFFHQKIGQIGERIEFFDGTKTDHKHKVKMEKNVGRRECCADGDHDVGADLIPKFRLFRNVVGSKHWTHNKYPTCIQRLTLRIA